MANTQAYLTEEDLPQETSLFETQFMVSPHLGRTGGGKIHIHFRLPTQFTISGLKASTPFLNYLQYHRVWITYHQFQNTSIVSAGYIFLKSPSLTHLEDYPVSYTHLTLPTIA